MLLWRTRRAAAAASLAVLACVLAGCASVSQEPPPDAFITGTAFSRERIYVPPGAVFEATLVDVSHIDAPPTVLGRQRVDPSGSAPFMMRIPYRSSLVHPQGRYAVRAMVSLGGRILFATDASHPVLQDPAFRQVDVILKQMLPNRATAQAEIPLLQTYWKLLALEDEPVTPAPSDMSQAHLVLQTDGARVTGSGGCNRFIGFYGLQGGRLEFRGLESTLRLCLTGGSEEGHFLRTLQAVRHFTQQGRELILRGEDGKPVLVLEAEELGLPRPEEENPPMFPQ